MELPKRKKLNLLGYTNYRHYLADFYNAKKEENPKFSYRLFSRKAGLSSPSYLLDTIKGKRNIIGKSLDGFSRALCLTARERHFFENLVHFNQAKSVEIKRHYYEQLLPILKKEHGTRLTKGQYEYFSRWYIPVIREMAALQDFRDDPSWISKKLRYKISPAEAKRAIQLLLELGLLTREKGNKFKLTDSTLTTPAEVADVCMTQFHQEMLNQAKESLLRDSGWHREVSGLTAALTLTQFKQIKQEIQEFQTKIMQRFEKPDTEATTVCQFNCQLFTLTDLNGVPHE